MWTLRSLVDHANDTQAEIGGRWVPARPLSTTGLYGLRRRIRDARAVLRGRAEAAVCVCEDGRA